MYVCQSVSWLTSLLKLDRCRDISCPGWYIFLQICWDIPGIFSHHFPIITNCLYVCQFVSWLSSLLNLYIYGDNSSSGWYIFLIFLGDILGTFVHQFQIFLIFFGDNPGMLVHLYQIILNFLYVCWSVCLLTSLLKLDNYRDISSFGWYIFLNFFGYIPGMLAP